MKFIQPAKPVRLKGSKVRIKARQAAMQLMNQRVPQLCNT